MKPFLHYVDGYGEIIQHNLTVSSDGTPNIPSKDEAYILNGEKLRIKDIIWDSDNDRVCVLAERQIDFEMPLKLCAEQMKHRTEWTLDGWPNHLHVCAKDDIDSVHKTEGYSSDTKHHKCRCGFSWFVTGWY